MATSNANENRINQLVNIALEMVTRLSLLSILPLVAAVSEGREKLIIGIAMWEKLWE